MTKRRQKRSRFSDTAPSASLINDVPVPRAPVVSQAPGFNAEMAAALAVRNAIAIQSCPPPAKRQKVIPEPLVLDASGREVDTNGNRVKQVAPGRSSFVKVVKSTREVARENSSNPYLAHRTKFGPSGVEKNNTEGSQGNTLGFDSRLKMKTGQRKKRRGIRFVTQGKIVEKAEKMRKAHSLYLNQKAAAKIAGGNTGLAGPELSFQVMDSSIGMSGVNANQVPLGGASRAKSNSSASGVPLRRQDDNREDPALEWWDIPFLPENEQAKYTSSKSTRKKKGGMSHLSHAKEIKEDKHVDLSLLSLSNCDMAEFVEHPVPFKLKRAKKKVEMKLMLTKKERKRVRRQARMEREKEKQEKIRLGLMAPPEPKVKISNLMRVLCNETVADPSAMERKVRAQMAQRVQNHEMRNQARKLTPAERKAKKLKKVNDDANKATFVAIFRVSSLNDPQKRFKIDINAQQSLLAGQALMISTNGMGGESDFSVVIVEGGPKSIRRFCKLMMRRINWSVKAVERTNNMEVDDENIREKEYCGGFCQLVWTGEVAKKSFKSFRFEACHNPQNARKVLEARGVAHYFDMLQSFTEKA